VRAIEKEWPCGYPGWFDALDGDTQADLLGEYLARFEKQGKKPPRRRRR
jgi:hypothetical protein